ncbi:ABC transporter permease [Flexivirga caeni]|uniref:ABC transporter permease n=1 Tax=Flexivirga caeni TaxID=2294115 RepID=UPI0011CDC77A|nr:ABC transporter permease [Flexivirga caeni]
MLGSLRGQWARALVLGAAVLIAVTSFVVLTGSVRASQLVTTGTVRANFRSSYDILVRPPKSTTAEERTAGEVRPNYLSGIYGGITMAQYASIKKLPGVQVAAPVAMLGQVFERVSVPADVTRFLPKDGRGAVRYTVTQVSQRGLSRIPGQQGFVYVTSNSLSLPPPEGSGAFGPYEQSGSGKGTLVCPSPGFGSTPAGSPFMVANQWQTFCWSRDGGWNGKEWSDAGQGRYAVLLNWSFPVTIAAIDPAAEAALDGVNKTVTEGRYLTAADRPQSKGTGDGSVSVPVLVSDTQLVDETAQVSISSLPGSVATRIGQGASETTGRRLVLSAPSHHLATFTVGTAGAYEQFIGSMDDRLLFSLVQAGPTTYTTDARGVLHAVPHSNPASTWVTPLTSGYGDVPPDASGTGFRTITSYPASNTIGGVRLSDVGTFDPTKIRGFSQLSKVPMETYQTPALTAANARTRKLLGGRDLLPNLNPAGYQQAPPMLLTTLAAIPTFTSPSNFLGIGTTNAPISVIRIRVQGVTGTDQASRDRVQQLALRIRKTTGLDVDITMGASPAPRTVDLPAGAHGVPALQVREDWVKKGAAYAIVSAIDRKSAILFALILIACALTVGNAAVASVRSRRTELGVLACLGWRPGTIRRSVIVELTVIGLTAGILGALLAIPVGNALGTAVTPARAVLAVPAGLVLTVVAGVVPGVRASRAAPLDAVYPAVVSPRRPIRLRGVTSTALAMLYRARLRAVTGALTLSIGVAALTTLLAIQFAFHGDVVGTLMGNAISVQVHGSDIAAAVIIALLGLISVADLLYLDATENAPHYATLQATGWRDATLLRLVITQAAVIGALGALIGASVGYALAASLSAFDATVVITGIVIGLAAVLATLAAAVIPAAHTARLNTARVLSAE